MLLPSSVGGRVTETVGLFECSAATASEWLVEQLGPTVAAHRHSASSVDDVVATLGSRDAVRRRALVPWGDWTVMLTDGPHGTDVGLLPSWAARTLGCRAIRATAAESGPGRFGAVIFEMYDPAATQDPLRCRRSIAAAQDGARWTFQQTGAPLDFEDQRRYRARLVRDRFTAPMLYSYLAALGVDPDTPLGLDHVVLVAPG
jgi:hypothetical protein